MVTVKIRRNGKVDVRFSDRPGWRVTLGSDLRLLAGPQPTQDDMLAIRAALAVAR